MRFNIARIAKGMQGEFFDDHIRHFAEEFGFANIKAASGYVRTGRQGLRAFTDYLCSRGFQADMYFLEPNRDLFLDVGENWTTVSRTSPSYGFTIPDDDPLLVEFKIKNF